MIHTTVLLAAPQRPVVGAEAPDPLTEVGGSSLIKRALLTLEQHGIHDVLLVLPEEDEGALRRSLTRDPDITARIVWLPQPAQRVLHVDSLLRARPYLADDSPALVLHANLLFSAEMVAPLVDSTINTTTATVLVDHDLHRVFDLDRALKVQCSSGRVQHVGFDIDTFDAVAVGMALVSPQLLDALDEDADRSIVALFDELAQRGVLGAQDVRGAQWQQVDSAQTRLHADWLVRAFGGALAPEAQPQMGSRRTPADPQRTLSYIEGLINANSARHYVLMNPGPVLTSPRVKSALVHHDVCHRDEDYAAVVRRLKRKLRRVCRGGPEHEILLLSGSGTAAVEATLSSCIPDDGRLLVVSNGAFGERFAEIAAVHRFDVDHLRYEWGELVDPAEVERRLRADPRIVAVCMACHETSVGILNPVHEVGRICRGLDRLFIVDAVSALGGEDIDVRRDKIDVLVSSANKCMHAVSGVSLACVHQRVWPRIEQIPPRVYYLDLKRYRDQEIPFTPAVSNFFALDAALDELLREGVEHRVERYRRLNSWLRAEFARIGLEPMTNTGHESHSITTLRIPAQIEFSRLYAALKERGYVVYGCKEHLKDRFFQIANMGELSDEMVRGFIDTLELVLQQHGAVRRDAAVLAASC